MKIQVNAYYVHENDLVRVIGAHGMNDAETMTFIVEWLTWENGKDERHTKEVTRRELSPAPTMERLYGDYQAALNVICQQANKIDGLEAERDDLMIKVQRLQGRNRYLMAPIQRRESPGNWMHVSHFVALLGKWGFTPLIPDIAKEMRYALLIDTFAEILQLQKWYDNGDDKEIRKSFDKVTKILIEIGAFDSGDKRDIDFQDWDELIPKCYTRIIQFVKGERQSP